MHVLFDPWRQQLQRGRIQMAKIQHSDQPITPAQPIAIAGSGWMQRTYQPAAASALRSFASGSPNQSTQRDVEASGTAAMLPQHPDTVGGLSGNRRRAALRRDPTATAAA